MFTAQQANSFVRYIALSIPCSIAHIRLLISCPISLSLKLLEVCRVAAKKRTQLCANSLGVGDRKRVAPVDITITFQKPSLSGRNNVEGNSKLALEKD